MIFLVKIFLLKFQISDLANDANYLKEEELFVQNISSFTDEFIKGKLRRAMAKIKLLNIGSFTGIESGEKKPFIRRSQKRSTYIITPGNLESFLAKKIAVNSVVCRR